MHILPQGLTIASEVGGENGSEAGVPNRESKPSAHASAPHARHDGSMARSVSVARQILDNFLPLWETPRPTSTVFKDVLVQESLVITMVSLRTWKGHGIPMFESRYKNMGFVNS